MDNIHGLYCKRDYSIFFLSFFVALQKPRVPLYCLFYALRLNADVSLCHACAGMLQKTLDKGNVKAVVAVDFCCKVFPKAMGADPLKAQVIAHKGKLLLNGSFGQRKDALIASDPVPQTVVFQILQNHDGNGENPLLPCFWCQGDGSSVLSIFLVRREAGFFPSFRPVGQETVSMRRTLVLPLSPLVLPPVMTTVSPGFRDRRSFAARSA